MRTPRRMRGVSFQSTMQPPPLQTSRLTLTPIALDDAPAFAAMMTAPAMAAHSDLPVSPDAEAAWHFINGQVDMMARNAGIAWTIRWDTNTVGFIRLILGQKNPQHALLSYEISSDHWGQGIATEAVSAACQAAFDTRGLGIIDATVHPDNAASLRVLEKSGFTIVPVATPRTSDKIRYRRTASGI